MAIRAKYAGICKATGRPYSQGTLIEQGPKGWQIAKTAATAANVAAGIATGLLSSDRVGRFVITNPDGTTEIKSQVLSQIVFCRCAKELPNFDLAKPETYEASRFTKTVEGDLLCPACGRRVHVLSDETPEARQEMWEIDILPNLYLSYPSFSCGAPGYVLSRKIGPEKWKMVAEFFNYWDADDLDQADYFDASKSGGNWFCSPDSVSAIEERLGILPENRFEAREAAIAERAANRERKEKEEAAAKQAAYEAACQQIRTMLEGMVAAYVDASQWETLSWEPLPALDKVDNEGGRYDISWFQASVNSAPVYRMTRHWSGSQGDSHLLFAPQSIIDAWYEAEWEAMVVEQGAAEAACALLRSREQNRANPYAGERDKQTLATRLVEVRGEEKFGDLLRSAYPAETEWVIPTGSYQGKEERILAERFGIPHAIAVWENLEKTEEDSIAESLKGRIPMYRDAFYLGSFYRHPDGRLFVETPRWANVKSRLFDVAASQALPVTQNVEESLFHDRSPDLEIIASRKSGIPFEEICDLHSYRTPAGGRLLRFEQRPASTPVGKRGERIPHTLDISDVREEEIAAVHAEREARQKAERAARDKKALRKRYARPTLERVVSSEKLAEKTNNRSNSGEWQEVHRVVLAFSDAPMETVYTATEGWWAMGEDGDASEKMTVHETESAARKAVNL